MQDNGVPQVDIGTGVIWWDAVAAIMRWLVTIALVRPLLHSALAYNVGLSTREPKSLSIGV